MEVEAKARYMRIPPRKARLVAATVIGLPVKEALTVLDFTPRAAAKEVGKVVKSAAANATNNFNQDEDTLFVKSIIVNEGPTLKRGRARALQAVARHTRGPVDGQVVSIIVAPGRETVGTAGSEREGHPEIEPFARFDRA